MYHLVEVVKDVASVIRYIHRTSEVAIDLWISLA